MLEEGKREKERQKEGERDEKEGLRGWPEYITGVTVVATRL